jgi:hypothetical protein
VSLVLVALLLVAAGWWAVRLVRGNGAIAAADVDPGVETAGGATATRTRPSVLTAASTDVAAHLVMSLGMAAMLVAML